MAEKSRGVSAWNFRANERRAELVRAMPSAAENLKANFRANERRAELVRAMPSAAENLEEKISKKRHYAIELAFDTFPQAYYLPGRSLAVAYPEDFVPGYYRCALYCLPGSLIIASARSASASLR